MSNPESPSDQGMPASAYTPNASGRDMQEPNEELEEEAGELGLQARETTEDVTRDAREAAAQMKEQAYSTADRQKEAAAQQMGSWAQALRTASDDLRNRGQEMAGAYVGQAADGLERASGTMRARQVDDLIGTVEEFARRQPVAFFGGAVAAGFGLARFMRSSADRRRSGAASAQTGQGDRPWCTPTIHP